MCGMAGVFYYAGRLFAYPYTDTSRPLVVFSGLDGVTSAQGSENECAPEGPNSYKSSTTCQRRDDVGDHTGPNKQQIILVTPYRNIKLARRTVKPHDRGTRAGGGRVAIQRTCGLRPSRA